MSGIAKTRSPKVSRSSKRDKSSSPERSKTSPKSGRKKTTPKRKTTITAPTKENKTNSKIVDFSSQGITALPSNVFANKEVTELLLPSNNIRSLPPEIRRLKNLTKLDLSRNGIRCMNPNDYGGLPAELETLTKLDTLILTECNFRYIPSVVWKIHSLVYLDISRNKVNVLSPEVGNLFKMKRLNCQETSITTLPPEIVYCDDLEELLLWGNTIETLPETMMEMRKLHTLAINTQGFTKLVDSYMETLLRNGQIQSEHVPTVLFEIPRLEKLDLESTMINNIPQNANTSLKQLYLNGNFFSEIPVALFNMDVLTDLEICYNSIQVIPDEISQMVSLRCLKLNSNSIEALPRSMCTIESLAILELGGNRINKLPPEIGNLHNLHTLVLEKNNLTALPSSICELSKLTTLDLTANKITKLPIEMYKMTSLTKAHCYRKLFKHGLWLHHNPLTLPPQEVWKTEDPKKIYDHLKQWKILHTENLQTLKVVVLGDYQCGKTSLLTSIGLQKSYLTRPHADSTRVFQQTKGQSSNDVKFSLWELGGHWAYQGSLPMFLGENSLYMLVYDHSTYTDDNFQSSIGQWLDLLYTYVPGSIVKLVGTKADLRSDDLRSDDSATSNILDSATRHVTASKQQFENNLQKIDKMIQNESDENSKKQLEFQRQKLLSLIANPPRIQVSISLTSAVEGTPGLTELLADLEYIAIQKDIFPHNQRHVPDYWRKLKLRIKKRPGYYVTMDEVLEEAKMLNCVNVQDITQCLQHLVDTGAIMWNPRNPALKNLIFHAPKQMAEIVSNLFRHDMKEYLDYDCNKVFGSHGKYNKEVFDQARDNLLQRGLVPRPLLRCLWFYQKLPEVQFQNLLDILSQIDCGYVIPQLNIPTSTSYREPLIVLPWFNRDIQPEHISDIWPSELELGESEGVVEFVFPDRFLHGIFERLVIRIQPLVEARSDWQDLVFAVYEGGVILLQRGLRAETYDLSIQVKVRGEGQETMLRKLTDVWLITQDLLSHIDGAVWYEIYSSLNCDVLVSKYLKKELKI